MSRKNKTQPKIESFISDFSVLCRKHGMLLDSNSGRDGSPLILYIKSGEATDLQANYRKVGYLWYSFSDETEEISYSFDPMEGSAYLKVHSE